MMKSEKIKEFGKDILEIKNPENAQHNIIFKDWEDLISIGRLSTDKNETQRLPLSLIVQYKYGNETIYLFMSILFFIFVLFLLCFIFYLIFFYLIFFFFIDFIINFFYFI